MKDLNTSSVVEFFNKRAGMETISPLNRAIFQEKHGDLAFKRDELERAVIYDQIKNYINKNITILDAGCGSGRFSFWLSPMVKHVEAFDISDGLIRLCKELCGSGFDNVNFSVGSIDNFDLGKFDIIIISGVCLYTRDETWSGIFNSLQKASSPGTIFVLRESMGRLGRHELRNVWSPELESRYSAVYRDPDWFRAIFGLLGNRLYDEPLFPANMEKWVETQQRLMIFKRIR